MHFFKLLSNVFIRARVPMQEDVFTFSHSEAPFPGVLQAIKTSFCKTSSYTQASDSQTYIQHAQESTADFAVETSSVSLSDHVARCANGGLQGNVVLHIACKEQAPQGESISAESSRHPDPAGIQEQVVAGCSSVTRAVFVRVCYAMQCRCSPSHIHAQCRPAQHCTFSSLQWCPQHPSAAGQHITPIPWVVCSQHSQHVVDRHTGWGQPIVFRPSCGKL